MKTQRLGSDYDIVVAQLQLRLCHLEIGIWRDEAFLQYENCFDQTCQSTCALQMPNIRLDRSDVNGRFAIIAEYSSNGSYLGKVACRGASSMGFYVPNRPRIYSGLFVDRSLKVFLGNLAGKSNSRSLTILVDSSVANYSSYGVTATNSIV